MATCKTYKIDSNVTGLSYAEEECPTLLPDTPTWYPLEPNSYNDFGGQITTLARNPINPTRQRKKGVTTDLEASGGFQQDFTFYNTERLMKGFMFTDGRIRASNRNVSFHGRVVPTTTTATEISFSGTFGTNNVKPGFMMALEGMGDSRNNVCVPVKTYTQSGNTCKVELYAASLQPSAADVNQNARVYFCGYRFAPGEMELVATANGQQELNRKTIATDLTTLPISAGDWIYLGDDTAANHYGEKKRGFGRIAWITAGTIRFDKWTWETAGVPAAFAGVNCTLYWGDTLKNEADPNKVKRFTYTLERRLGRDADGEMSELLRGAVPNEFTLNIAQADKITADMTFVAADFTQRDGKTGIMGGARETLEVGSAFNTSSDFNRIKLSTVDELGKPSNEPLFAFATELSVSIKNNVSPVKAVGVLGALDTSAGTFEVGGNMTVYFANVEATRAIRNNTGVTLDIIMLKDGKAVIIDIPLLTLGNGRINIEQDQAITVPLEINAAESSFGHTLCMQWFHWLPKAAFAQK
ncbi:phage tail tube protein [uncultured Rothia sp.]|uniref:phage tail tube protein n=1 Tax=uncultured Rothia sp. TaxID=316088 RepID=UPI0025F7C420|nr:phage tail tube protein [uncultured Rothia sp.]